MVLQLIVSSLFLLLFVFIVYSYFSQIYQSLFQADRFVPFVPARGEIAQKIVEFADIKDGHKVIDLGSGTGTLVYGIAKRRKVDITGIEISTLLDLIAKARKFFFKTKFNITFKRGDLLKEDLSQYDRIVFFLTPNIVKNYLHDKFVKECKKDVVIVSHGFRMESDVFSEECYETGFGSFQKFVYVYRRR